MAQKCTNSGPYMLTVTFEWVINTHKYRNVKRMKLNLYLEWTLTVYKVCKFYTVNSMFKTGKLSAITVIMIT